MKQYIYLLSLFLLIGVQAQAQNYILSCNECTKIYQSDCNNCPPSSSAGVTTFEGLTVKVQGGGIAARIPAPFTVHYDSQGNVTIYTRSQETNIAGSPTKITAKLARFMSSTGQNYPTFQALNEALQECGGCVVSQPQVLSIDGDDISLSGGGGTVMITHPPNLDNDPTNEYNTAFNFTNTTLSITDGGGVLSVDLSALLDNTDNQQLQPLSFIGNVLTVSLEDGGTQQINLSGLISAMANNPTATYTHTNGNGNSTNIGYTLAYNPATNVLELRDIAGNLANSITIQREYNTGLTLVNDQLNLTDGNGTLSVDLAQYLDNTDGQTLSLIGSTLSITGGNSVILPPDNDADPTNELNTGFSIVADQLNITDAGGTLAVDLSPYNSPDTHLFSDDKVAFETRKHDLATFNFSMTHDNDAALQIGDGIGLLNASTDAALFYKQDGAIVTQVGLGNATALGGNANAASLFSGNVGAGAFSSLNLVQGEILFTSQTPTHVASSKTDPTATNPTVNYLLRNNVDNFEVGFAALDTPTKKFSNIFYGSTASGTIEDVSRVEVSNIATSMFFRYDLALDKDNELTIDPSGLLFKNTDNSNLLSIDIAGKTTLHKYPETRDDSGTTPPQNFLYTDANGAMQSAPIAELVPPAFIALTEGTDLNDYNPTSFDVSNMVYINATTNIDITGFAALPYGTKKTITNSSINGSELNLKKNDGNSLLANQLKLADDIKIKAGHSVEISYSPFLDGWTASQVE